MEHTLDYHLIYNSLTNGKPFTKERALTRIKGLADSFAITHEEAQELEALAREKGVDALPGDALGRLTNVEEKTDELILAMADMMGGAL